MASAFTPEQAARQIMSFFRYRGTKPGHVEMLRALNMDALKSGLNGDDFMVGLAAAQSLSASLPIWDGSLQRLPEPLGQKTDDSFAKQKHAEDEYHALDYCNPGTQGREVVLHRDDDCSPDERPKDRSHSPQERHQNHLS